MATAEDLLSARRVGDGFYMELSVLVSGTAPPHTTRSSLV